MYGVENNYLYSSKDVLILHYEDENKRKKTILNCTQKRTYYIIGVAVSPAKNTQCPM